MLHDLRAAIRVIVKDRWFSVDAGSLYVLGMRRVDPLVALRDEN